MGVLCFQRSDLVVGVGSELFPHLPCSFTYTFFKVIQFSKLSSLSGIYKQGFSVPSLILPPQRGLFLTLLAFQDLSVVSQVVYRIDVTWVFSSGHKLFIWFSVSLSLTELRSLYQLPNVPAFCHIVFSVNVIILKKSFPGQSAAIQSNFCFPIVPSSHSRGSLFLWVGSSISSLLFFLGSLPHSASLEPLLYRY